MSASAESSPSSGPKRWTERKGLMIFLIGVSLVPTVAVILLFPVANRIADSQWRQFRHQWEEKGEIFDLSQLVDAPVPDRDNFAKSPLIAEFYPAGSTGSEEPGHKGHHHSSAGPAGPHPARLSSLTYFSEKRILSPSPAPVSPFRSGRPVDLGLHVPAEGGDRLPTDYLLSVLAPHEAVFDELLDASQRPDTYFAPQNGELFPRDLSHFPALIPALHGLRIESLALIETGEAERDRAAERLTGTLRTILRGTDCPGLASFTVRTLALESAGLEVVWQGLYRQSFSDAQWAAIDRELRAFEFGPLLLRTLRFERSVLVSQVEANFAAARTRPFSVPPAWVHLNGLQKYGELTQRYWFTRPGSDAILHDQPSVEQFAAIEALVRDLPNTPQGVIIAAGVIPVHEMALRFQDIEIQRDHALVAIALERHRLAHGDFPDSLSVLVPDFLGELPYNAETGHPPRYERPAESTGYQLRTFGEAPGEGDAVWIMPPLPQLAADAGSPP